MSSNTFQRIFIAVLSIALLITLVRASLLQRQNLRLQQIAFQGGKQ